MTLYFLPPSTSLLLPAGEAGSMMHALEAMEAAGHEPKVSLLERCVKRWVGWVGVGVGVGGCVVVVMGGVCLCVCVCGGGGGGGCPPVRGSVLNLFPGFYGLGVGGWSVLEAPIRGSLPGWASRRRVNRGWSLAQPCRAPVPLCTISQPSWLFAALNQVGCLPPHAAPFLCRAERSGDRQAAEGLLKRLLDRDYRAVGAQALVRGAAVGQWRGGGARGPSCVAGSALLQTVLSAVCHRLQKASY